MIKNILFRALFSTALLLSITSCSSEANDTSETDKESIADFAVNFNLDAESNLKNPYMGWTLYSEGTQKTDKPTVYWALQDEAAQKYAGVYYIRWRWSDLEPEEGKYAWDHNEDFKGLIKGALDRGLRLAFRIYVNGRDNLYAATPDYVLAGAATYEVAPGHQTPYPDDEFFLTKYTKFIEAFGRKFNAPSIVDYVDSYGLGWWGEEHNIQYKDASRKYETHDRIVKAYEKAFNRVINVINFGVRDDRQEKVVYDELGFTSRRDGYASSHFPPAQQKELVSHFPKTPIIAEACYWGGKAISSLENGKWSNWSAYYKDVVDLAIETHANYLDLRTPTETARYLSDAKDEVKKFIAKGGYRIYPKSVNGIIKSDKLHIEHTWLNVANGVLPNNNSHLGYKYKVAFGLFDNNNQLVKKWLSDNVEVSNLVNLKEIKAQDTFDISNLSQNSYKLGIAIINTRENDSKDIKLAIKRPQLIKDEWVLVKDDILIE